MSETLLKAKSEKPKRKRKIPASLIKETIDGIPFYYQGYRSVLNKTKKLEDIIPDSGLQLFIKRFFFNLLNKNLDPKDFEVFMGEVGSHLDHRNNMGLDVTVYDRNVLTRDKITLKYIDVAPKIVIEIDVNVEIEDKTTNLFEDFVLRKIRRLHDFGTEKIIWVFTKSKTVIVANPDNNWQVLDWDKDVEILEGVQFNIAKYLDEEGIQV